MLESYLIEELTSGCECGSYCFWKEYIQHSAIIDPRYVIQLKCVEIFKYEESERQQRELTTSQTMQLWVDRGYAAAFAELYDKAVDHKEKIHIRIIYAQITE
jgi:hypothetical protein